MTLVTAELVFADDRWQREYGFVVQGGGILATGPPGDLADRFPEHEHEDWGNVAVLPGCVNGHAHSFQVLLRGLGDDLAFARWRDRVLYPYSQGLDRDALHTGALFGFAVIARAGITTAVHFSYLHDRGNTH